MRFTPTVASGFWISLGWASCLSLTLSSCRSSPSGHPPSKEPSVTQGATQIVAWSPAVEVARGPARAGPWRMNESEFHYVDDPTVALRADGSIAVAWVDNRNKDVWFQLFGADGRALRPAPVNVSRSPDVFSWLPRMLIGPDGGVCILWQEIVFSGGSHGGEIFFASSEEGGGFGAPINLTNSLGGDGKGRLTKEIWDNGSLDLALGADRTLLAAWTEYDGALWFSRSTDGGKSFSLPQQIAGSSEKPARGPALAANGTVVYLAWAVGEDPAADIQLAASNDGGRSFQPARAVLETSGHGDAPKLALDGDNVLHLVHAESESGLFGTSHVRYLRQRAAGASFEQPRNLSALGPQPGGASFPSLSLGPRGYVYVVWQQHRAAGEAPRGLGFVASSDGGRTFTSPVLVPGSTDPELGVNGSRQGKLMRLMASDRTGALAVVSSSFRAAQASRIRPFRGRVQHPPGDAR